MRMHEAGLLIEVGLDSASLRAYSSLDVPGSKQPWLLDSPVQKRAAVTWWSRIRVLRTLCVPSLIDVAPAKVEEDP
jgi:hypothetical protein